MYKLNAFNRRKRHPLSAELPCPGLYHLVRSPTGCYRPTFRSRAFEPAAGSSPTFDVRDGNGRRLESPAIIVSSSGLKVRSFTAYEVDRTRRATAAERDAPALGKGISQDAGPARVDTGALAM